MARPIFQTAWAQSLKVYDAADPLGKVATVIGGFAARNINAAPPHNWQNTCAVRMSYILNYSSVSVPATTGKTVTGADKRNYFLRVPDVIAFLKQRWGDADLVTDWPPSGGGKLA